jgi:hypothetical protein
MRTKARGDLTVNRLNLHSFVLRDCHGKTRFALRLRNYSAEQLLKLEKNRAASLVQIFENSLWPDFRSLLPLAGKPDRLQQAARQVHLRDAVIGLMRGTERLDAVFHRRQADRRKRMGQRRIPLGRGRRAGQ